MTACAARVACCLLALFAKSATAEEVLVAVAANFSAPMKMIAADFEKSAGHRAVLSFGATGKFYAQITGGAPFEILLSADEITPARLAREGKAVAATRFTYATGTLVLWSAKRGLVDPQGEVLRKGDFKRLAIASPSAAPYGAAAVETMNKLGVHESLKAKLVVGESIGQAFSFVETGNAELGFVALSQVYENGKIRSGSAWLVPESLHSPIRQDAVLLTRGTNKPAAAALLAYLRTDKARAVIRAFGYQP